MSAPAPTDLPFGARFLEANRRLGGGLSTFTWAEVQEIKRCDPEELAQALREAQPLTPWAAIQRIRSAKSPEELAADVWREPPAHAPAATSMVSFWMFLALLT